MKYQNTCQDVTFFPYADTGQYFFVNKFISKKEFDGELFEKNVKCEFCFYWMPLRMTMAQQFNLRHLASKVNTYDFVRKVSYNTYNHK